MRINDNKMGWWITTPKMSVLMSQHNPLMSPILQQWDQQLTKQSLKWSKQNLFNALSNKQYKPYKPRLTKAQKIWNLVCLLEESA